MLNLNKTGKKLLSLIIANNAFIWLLALVQWIIRSIAFSSFSIKLENYIILISILCVVCLIYKIYELYAWKHTVHKPSEYSVNKLNILDIKIGSNLTYEEASDMYWKEYWDKKFQGSFQKFESISKYNRDRFNSITREIKYEDLPKEVKRKIEKAA